MPTRSPIANAGIAARASSETGFIRLLKSVLRFNLTIPRITSSWRGVSHILLAIGLACPGSDCNGSTKQVYTNQPAVQSELITSLIYNSPFKVMKNCGRQGSEWTVRVHHTQQSRNWAYGVGKQQLKTPVAVKFELRNELANSPSKGAPSGAEVSARSRKVQQVARLRAGNSYEVFVTLYRFLVKRWIIRFTDASSFWRRREWTRLCGMHASRSDARACPSSASTRPTAERAMAHMVSVK